MRLRERVNSEAETLLTAFKAGKVPAPLAPDLIPAHHLYIPGVSPPVPEMQRFIDSLPFIEVARHWKIAVSTFAAAGNDRFASYSPAGSISLGVKNLSTWGHELIHAADHRCLDKFFGFGTKLDKEVVAEFGAAILLESIGRRDDSDRGGAWELIQRECAAAGVDPVSVCQALLSRTCNAVTIVLEAAQQLENTKRQEAERQWQIAREQELSELARQETERKRQAEERQRAATERAAREEAESMQAAAHRKEAADKRRLAAAFQVTALDMKHAARLECWERIGQLVPLTIAMSLAVLPSLIVLARLFNW